MKKFLLWRFESASLRSCCVVLAFEDHRRIPMVRRRGEEEVVAESEAPERLIPRTLNECQELQSVHLRTVKELVKCRSGHHGPQRFLKVWCECLRPIFLVRERELAVERVVRFVATFTAYRDEEHANDCDDFVEEFLKHLLQLAGASDRTVRYRTCQLISEVGVLTCIPNLKSSQTFRMEVHLQV